MLFAVAEAVAHKQPWYETTVALVFIILGGIATIATLAWVAWIVLGVLFTKPRVRLEFGRRRGREGPMLTVDFFNDPLSQWPFSFLNIKRQDIDGFSILAGLYDMKDCLICAIDTALHDRQNHHDFVFPLPASPFSLFWAPVSFDEFGPSVMDVTGVQYYLEPGTYKLQILLHADEVDVRTVAQRFVAGIDEPVFQWIGKPYGIRPRRFHWLRRLLGYPLSSS